MYGVFMGYVGMADVASDSKFDIPAPLKSVEDVGAIERDVKAFIGSERFNE